MNTNTLEQSSQNQNYENNCKSPPKAKLRHPNFEIKTTMDLCNLYVKGIRPGLTSIDLFNLFKPFGRIISARVMEDNNTKCKAGFGFVSFSSSVEAAQAMIEMYIERPTFQKDKDETKDDVPIMTARFHEPRVPRPEHNYNQQLELLSNSVFSAHFYTRQQQKIVPLQPTENHQSIFSAPAGNENHSTIANVSPNLPLYFPSSSNNPPFYFYQPYWTDNQGIMYTGYVNSLSPLPPPPQSPLPASHQCYQYNQYSSNSKKQNQQRHSWNGNTIVNSSSESTLDKLMELLDAPEYEISASTKPKLIKKLMKLNKIEQSNCLNNSVYFKRKISFLLDEQ